MPSPKGATRSGLRRRLRRDRCDRRAVVTTTRPAVELLAQALATAGVGAAYGRPYAGLPVTKVADPRVALLLCHAHRAVHGAPAVAHLGGGRLVVVSRRPAPATGAQRGDRSRELSLPAPVRVIDDAEELFTLGPAVAEAGQGEGLCLELDIDPGALLREGAVALPTNDDEYPEPEPSLVADLSAAQRVIVLAGPDVIGRRAVGGLRALAAAGRLGVLNTWGAKGVFHWRSRHHWATVGLQELDFELAGLPGADVVLAVGLDEEEAPERLWSPFPHRRVRPELLGPLAERWGVPGPFPDMPPLRDRLAAVTQAGWAATGSPLMPSLVTRHYAAVFGHGGLVAADPGTAGFWVARTFATTRLGTAFVPGQPLLGWAAACVLVARLVAPWRPGLAVVDGPLDEHSRAVLEQGLRLGIPIALEAWQADGERLDAEAHLARLSALAGGRPDVVSLATDDHQLADMIAVAGPIRAWTND